MKKEAGWWEYVLLGMLFVVFLVGMFHLVRFTGNQSSEIKRKAKKVELGKKCEEEKPKCEGEILGQLYLGGEWPSWGDIFKVLDEVDGKIKIEYQGYGYYGHRIICYDFWVNKDSVFLYSDFVKPKDAWIAEQKKKIEDNHGHKKDSR